MHFNDILIEEYLNIRSYCLQKLELQFAYSNKCGMLLGDRECDLFTNEN